MTRGRLLGLGALLSAGVLVAQEPAAQRFDRAYAACVADDQAGTERWAAALDWFLRIPPDDPAWSARLAAGARAALEAGDPARGLEWARARLARAPDDRAAQTVALLGVLETAGGEAALHAAQAARSRLPAAVDDFLLEASSRREGALFVAAQAALRRGETALGMAPIAGVAELLAARATAVGATARDRHAAAIALGNHGLALRQTGALDAALERYVEACALHPDDDVLWSDRALAEKAAGRLDAALVSLRRSLEVEAAPATGPAITNLGVLIRHQPDRAAAIAAAVAELLERADIAPAADAAPAAVLRAALGLAVDVRPQTELRRRLLVDAILPPR